MKRDWVKWSEIEKTVQNYNPLFAKLFNQLLAGDDVNLLRFRFPFGAKLLDDKGKLLIDLPTSSASADPSFPKKDHYDYSKTIPLCMVLTRSFEVWANTQIKKWKGQLTITAPKLVATPGIFLGLFETFTPVPVDSQRWQGNINAGARTLFIASDLGTQEIKAYQAKHTSSGFPKERDNSSGVRFNDDQHWEIIKAIVDAHVSADDWYAEIILFDSKVFPWLSLGGFDALQKPETLNDQTPQQKALIHYFVMATIDQLSRAAEAALGAQGNMKKREERLTARTAVHIASGLNGRLPLLAPFTADDDLFAPCKQLKEIFSSDPIHYNGNFILLGAKQRHNEHALNTVYYSLYLSFADFDWEMRDRSPANLVSVVEALLKADQGLLDTWEINCLTKAASSFDEDCVRRIKDWPGKVFLKEFSKAGIFEQDSKLALLPTSDGTTEFSREREKFFWASLELKRR